MLNTKLLGIKRKLKKIKLIVMDFDGVLTDGGIYLGNDELSSKIRLKRWLGIKLTKHFN